MDPRIIATAAKVGHVIESVLAALRPGRDGPTAKTLRIITHRSLSDAGCLTVRGRVVREAPTNRRQLRRNGAVTAREHVASMYRAFDAVELPYARVTVSHRGVEVSGPCDKGGYFAIDLHAAPGEVWAGGQHTPSVHLETGEPSQAVRVESSPAALADVFVPGVRATLLVISDLDDTAMDTHTMHHARMVRTVLLRSAKRRHPVAGVPALYRALRDGLTGDADNPVCYISSGAWNLYQYVVDYIDTHALPAGAVLLNDWGSRGRGFHPVSHAHKGAHVSALLARLPSLPLLLIGDDVQEDPELYATVATRNPGRVDAVWVRLVRDTRSRRAAIELLRAPLEAAGTDLIVSNASHDFEADARRRGWIR